MVENGQVVVRPMNYLALSYDHRIIDGREAVLRWWRSRKRWKIRRGCCSTSEPSADRWLNTSTSRHRRRPGRLHRRDPRRPARLPHRLHRRLEDAPTAGRRPAAPAPTSAAFPPRRCCSRPRTSSTPATHFAEHGIAVDRPRHRRRADARAQGRGRAAEQRRHPVSCSRRTRSASSTAAARSSAADGDGGWVTVAGGKPSRSSRAKHVIVATGSIAARPAGRGVRRRAHPRQRRRAAMPGCRRRWASSAPASSGSRWAASGAAWAPR